MARIGWQSYQARTQHRVEFSVGFLSSMGGAIQLFLLGHGLFYYCRLPGSKRKNRQPYICLSIVIIVLSAARFVLHFRETFATYIVGGWDLIGPPPPRERVALYACTVLLGFVGNTLLMWRAKGFRRHSQRLKWVLIGVHIAYFTACTTRLVRKLRSGVNEAKIFPEHPPRNLDGCGVLRLAIPRLSFRCQSIFEFSITVGVGVFASILIVIHDSRNSNGAPARSMRRRFSGYSLSRATACMLSSAFPFAMMGFAGVILSGCLAIANRDPIDSTMAFTVLLQAIWTDGLSLGSQIIVSGILSDASWAYQQVDEPLRPLDPPQPGSTAATGSRGYELRSLP
ncbi:hypothetical protein BKA70DRAFT_1343628 [Coprinopsis sp. MPI-PUGE-AT-0042]|nr:hypothetical protein BKA70DRAFT_1343628 [Coprinopsis sp. MPI-PUGE-AT-0042]